MLRECISCGRTLVPNPQRRDWAHCPTCEPEWASWAAHAAYQERVRPALMHVGIPSWPHRG